LISKCSSNQPKNKSRRISALASKKRSSKN
jgi:hypothetical protein